MAFTVEQFARQLKQLLPRGLLWKLDPDSVLSESLLALGEELTRVSDRGADVLEESDPRTASETLEEWERALGLPDDIVTDIPATDAERQTAITQKYTARGGQSEAYFIAFALACGFTAEITDFHASLRRCGSARCGDRIYGPDWVHVWRMTLTDKAVGALDDDAFRRAVELRAPAHTVVHVVFAY